MQQFSSKHFSPKMLNGHRLFTLQSLMLSQLEKKKNKLKFKFKFSRLNFLFFTETFDIPESVAILVKRF